MPLLTQLGLDTGFATPHENVYPNCHAGMELDITRRDAPYIVKSPWLCDLLDDLCQSRRLIVDHLLIPVRDLHAAAQSRIAVEQAADPRERHGPVPVPVPGGLWDAREPGQQHAVLAEKLYALIHAAAKHDIPTTLLYFPRLVMDGAYLYSKLRRALPRLKKSRFRDAFRTVRRPELVHDFSPAVAKKVA
jgi:hypothetical protein